jgi:hypothetical protein
MFVAPVIRAPIFIISALRIETIDQLAYIGFLGLDAALGNSPESYTTAQFWEAIVLRSAYQSRAKQNARVAKPRFLVSNLRENSGTISIRLITHTRSKSAFEFKPSTYVTQLRENVGNPTTLLRRYSFYFSI